HWFSHRMVLDLTFFISSTSLEKWYYVQTSDSRVKNNFSASPGLKEILALSPKRYRHYECLNFEPESKKMKLGKNFINKVGFLAQDVKKVIPEAVTDTGSEDALYGIDYSCIVACLVQAVQELNGQVAELRTQLQAFSA
ncbi:tail fiber domain-containing protein, partial [Microcoleus sp. F4-D5]|uniref:tail fiber domain-containing protein n=1 Tax=Microcoleus sp. F4-D5 TaxID=2818760 RepID=UPI002FD11180